MAIKRLEAIYKFLQAARNLVKNKDMSKESILRFAKQEFGEVSQFLRKQIDDIFKAKPKTEKKGDVVPIKEKINEKIAKGVEKKDPELANLLRQSDDLDEGIMATDDAADIKKVIGEKEEVGDDFIDFVRKQGDEEGANKIQKEVDRLNKAIEDADKRVKATEIAKKRTSDIAKGDVEGTGVESLETSMKNIKKATEELKKTKITPESIFENMIKGQRVMAEGYKTGNIRTAVREFMRSEVKAGRLKLNETDSFRIREYSPMTEDDPIDVFRRYYGEDALEAVDEIGDVFQRGESFKHYEQLLRENVDSKILTVKKIGAGDYDPNVVSAEKIRKAKEQEAKQKKILEDFDIDPDRDPNAHGGIIGNLRLNRTGFGIGSVPKGFKLAKRIRDSKEYKDFIEMLFIKASNMIRQGKGMFKNLDESQRIKQHDNLTQEVTKYQKTGELDEGVYQYFGINPEHVYVQRLIEAEKKTQMTDALKKWDPGKDRKPNAEGGLINILKL